jgi:hypothetical protein
MIGGTAYVAGKAGQRAAYRQQDAAAQEQDQDARLANLEAQQPAPQQPPAAAAPATDVVAQLGELAKLKDSGALTDAEFEAAKRQLLGT